MSKNIQEKAFRLFFYLSNGLLKVGETYPTEGMRLFFTIEQNGAHKQFFVNIQHDSTKSIEKGVTKRLNQLNNALKTYTL